MNNELMLGSFGDPAEDRRGLLSRQSRDLRGLERRSELKIADILHNANEKVLKEELRKRFTEKTMYDTRDVVDLFQQLADGDQVLAAALMPLVQEFVQQSARDVRTFTDRDLGF